MTLHRVAWTYGWVGVWGAVLLTSYAVRPLVPIDETRYVGVAWEMWHGGDFLVPHLNGEPYADKPPLLFWLMNMGWGLFGVNEWWPRLVPPLFALAALFTTRRLARRLWPDVPAAADIAPWLLTGSLFWAIYTPAVMFDMVLTALVAAAMAVLLTIRAGRPAGWALFGLIGGLGVLTKGPVALLHILFPALLAPWWALSARRRPAPWFAGLALAQAVAAALALAWALPAAESGGEAYASAILWHQTADRLVESFAHARPWWWYLPLLPVLLFPWSVWPPLWRSLRSRSPYRSSDAGTRFALAWLLPTFTVFALLSGKQAHYLLPLFPPAALLAARALASIPADQWRTGTAVPAAGMVLFGVALAAIPAVAPADSAPWLKDVAPAWGLLPVMIGVGLYHLRHVRSAPAAVGGLASATTALVITAYVALFSAGREAYDLRPTAQRIAAFQDAGIPVAYIGGYHDQFQFAGRLRQHLDVVSGPEVRQWREAHPQGLLIRYCRRLDRCGKGPHLFRQLYRTGWMVIIGNAVAETAH